MAGVYVNTKYYTSPGFCVVKVDDLLHVCDLTACILESYCVAVDTFEMPLSYFM